MKKANAVIGILYSVSIRVQNPTYIVGPMYFHMQSYEKDMTAMDEVAESGRRPSGAAS